MSIHFDKAPKDKVRRKEIAIFLLQAKEFKRYSHTREGLEAFCRGMAMAYWLEEHKHLLATADEFCIPI